MRCSKREQRILSFCYEPTNRMNHRLAISPDLSIISFVYLSILCISVVHSVHRVWSYIKQTEKQTISTFFFMNQSTNHQCTVHEPFSYHPPLTLPTPISHHHRTHLSWRAYPGLSETGCTFSSIYIPETHLIYSNIAATTKKSGHSYPFLPKN